MQISVKSNLGDLTRRIKSYRDQIPQATAMALNSTAFDFRKEIVSNTWPKSVMARNSRFMNAALRVKNASKKALTVTIFDSLKREYLARLDSSGNKVPMGNHIAIPARDVAGQVRGANGAVRKAYKPRTLLNKKGFFRQTLKSGTDAIMERPKKGRGPLKIWYLLEPRAHIPKMFPFYETATRIVKQRLEINFRNAFRRAVITRR
jgi:hypothetical protein